MITTRLIRLLLRLAPKPFRERYASELIQLHRRYGVEQVGWRRVWFGGREVVGITLLVIRLRLGAAHPAGFPLSSPRKISMFDTLSQDVRFALRAVRRHPAYALAAVLVLALGIGANTAIFSAANAYFFRPLPFGDTDRLVMLYETNPEFEWTDATGAPANVLDWREQVDAFQDVASYYEFANRVTWIGDDGEPRVFTFATVSGNFFDVLGVRPVLGRSFRDEETWAPDDDVVILSHSVWVTQFGADSGIVGRSLDFGRQSLEVVGVMPEGFTYPLPDTDMWTPAGWDRSAREQVWFRRAHWVRPIARLAPGVSLEQANAQLQVVVDRLAADYPETNRVMGAGMMPLRDFMTREIRTPLHVLLGAVGMLLLLACANVANLTLVRASDRKREMALRFAMGAGRGRVVRLMITESLVLAVLGGGLGLALGWVGVRFMERLTPLGIEGATGIALDGRVMLFAFVASLLSGVLFGVLPALRASATAVGEALKVGGRGTGAGGTSGAVGALVAMEVAVAVLLVVGAGLMVRSIWELRTVDPGFTTQGTLAVQFTVPSSRYPARDQVLGFYDRFAAALEGRPGIASVGTVAQLPLAGQSWSSQFQAEGWPPERVGFEIVHRRADAGYFAALEIPLLRGRMFGPQDGADGPRVALINETFAAQHFPGEDPIGQRIAYERTAAQDPDAHEWWEIVGIVADQHQRSPGAAPVAEVFEHRDQDWSRTQWVVLRTSGDPLAAVPAVRETLRELDALIPLARVRPLREVWRESMAREEFLLTLLTVFATVALTLAAVGVYGVTAQAARARTYEIGIRMALGANAESVIGLMLRRGLVMVAVGLGAGLGVSLVSSRALQSFLFGVEPTDPATLAAVVALLAGVGTVACYLPARRAARVDPVSSLRAE